MNLLSIDNFATETICDLFKDSIFIKTEYGEEIENFKFTPPEHVKSFCDLLNLDVTISECSGKFLKYNTDLISIPPIENQMFQADIALQDTYYRTYKLVDDDIQIESQLFVPKRTLIIHQPWAYPFSFTDNLFHVYKILKGN